MSYTHTTKDGRRSSGDALTLKARRMASLVVVAIAPAGAAHANEPEECLSALSSRTAFTPLKSKLAVGQIDDQTLGMMRRTMRNERKRPQVGAVILWFGGGGRNRTAAVFIGRFFLSCATLHRYLFCYLCANENGRRSARRRPMQCRVSRSLAARADPARRSPRPATSPACRLRANFSV
jgi:hypothetical protein